MADSKNSKISELTELTAPSNADFIPIVDTANTETKKISYSSLISALNTDDDSYSSTEIDALIASGMWYYADQASFPDASSNHGRVVHNHANGSMYYAHGGVWYRIENESESIAARLQLQQQIDQNELDADSAISQVASDLTDYETSNNAAIATLQTDVDNNETAANAAIAAVQADVDNNEADADAAIAAVQADVDQNETAISSNTANIATANTNIATANTNIATNATNIATKAPLDSPDFTGNVGVNVTNPSKRLEVGGDVDVTGQVDADSVQANNYYGGAGAFASTSISGDLTVSGDITLTSSTSSITAPSSVGIGGDLGVSGQISSNQKIDCPQILANIGKIGDVEFTVSDCSIQVGGSDVVKLNNQGITLSDSATSFVKEDCYFKDGAVRLQKASSADDEILMRYLGQNSNDFVIQQFSGGNEKGHIKFLGNTNDGCKVRLEADHVDIGYNRSGFETNLVKIYSDTNIGANKKLAFTDTRDATDGLQFYHTGVRSTTGEAGRDAIQMGMYGSYPDSNIGEFKITHKIGTASNTDVLSVSPSASEVKIHKPLNLGNVPVFADNTAASTLSAGDVYRTSTGVLMIKY